MESLRDRMEADLKIGEYSPRTRKIYLLYARLFAKYHMRSPREMAEQEIRQYLHYLVEVRMASTPCGSRKPRTRNWRSTWASS